jgi:hypothetical protein
MISKLGHERADGDLLHFHGGYVFMVEYDIQRYLRRIKGLILTCGDPQDELDALGDMRWPRPCSEK